MPEDELDDPGRHSWIYRTPGPMMSTCRKCKLIRREINNRFLLYLIDGHWDKVRPDCRAFAADAWRTDQ